MEFIENLWKFNSIILHYRETSSIVHIKNFKNKHHQKHTTHNTVLGRYNLTQAFFKQKQVIIGISLHELSCCVVSTRNIYFKFCVSDGVYFLSFYCILIKTLFYGAFCFSLFHSFYMCISHWLRRYGVWNLALKSHLHPCICISKICHNT